MQVRKIASVLAVTVSTMWAVHASAGDCLVVAAGDGTYKPGLAKSWVASGNSVVFELNAGTDGAAVAATLKERLATATVAFAGGKLTIAGVPAAALLDQLSGLSLSGEADPLAALAGLGSGGSGGGEHPEGGGSIRASKPTALPPGIFPTAAAPAPAASGAAESDPSERLEAEVLEVTRAVFPQVALKLRVRKSATQGASKAKLVAGKPFEATMRVAAPLDLANAAQQRNAGAYYLKRGDKVLVHAEEASAGAYVIDWIERR